MGRYGITKLYWKRLAKDILDLEYLNLKNLTKVVDKITNFYFGHKLTSEGSHFDFGNASLKYNYLSFFTIRKFLISKLISLKFSADDYRPLLSLSYSERDTSSSGNCSDLFLLFHIQQRKLLFRTVECT